MNSSWINTARSFLCVLCFFITRKDLAAQKNDTLSLLRDFVSISNGYKQLPLYLELEMQNSTNFITGQEDTTDVRAEFYLRQENSYIRLGEYEQLVNDSLALLVSDNLQQMILYMDAGPVIERMKSMMGLAMPDSSLHRLAAKYMSSQTELSEKASLITLQSRAVLYGTALPKETIELQYNVSQKMPEQVTTMTRTFLPLDSLQYHQLQNESSISDKLFALEGSYFLVKEQVTAYVYKQIKPASAVKVPVLISDRVVKNEEGVYEPVKNYQSYRLVKNE